MTPEAEARTHIDASLRAGWIQDYKTLNLGGARGIAVREVPLKSGRCDYLLLVDRKPVVVEAKKKGTTLSSVSEQSTHYSESLPDFLAVPSSATNAIHILVPDRFSPSIDRRQSPIRWRIRTLFGRGWRKCRLRIPSLPQACATARSKLSDAPADVCRWQACPDAVTHRGTRR